MDSHFAYVRVSCLGLLGLVSIVSATMFTMSGLITPAASAQVTIGGPFALTAPDGTTVTDMTYRGKWLLVFFGYTFCPDLCPTTLSEFAGALDKLGPEAAKVQPLFITVDPERDTPEVMGEYTEAFDSRIVGLTGSPQQIAAVAQAYGAYGATHKAGAGDEDYLVDHSTYLYIMDPRGRFQRGLDFDTSSDRIADALRELMAQSDG